MIIENPDTFKSWLTSILEPLCDADPAALAKYVYALVKKEKPLDELREGMLDQLDVFLQHETKPFVDMLFKSLETNEYLKLAEQAPTSPASTQPLEQAGEPTLPVLPADVNVVSTNGVQPPEQPAPVPPRAKSPTKQRVVVRANKQPPRHAHEQTLVKVLPLNELLDEPIDQLPRRRDRRADSAREKDGDRRRRRSRSWERRVRARRHRDNHNDTDRRRIPSRSPSPRGRYRNRSPPMIAAVEPPLNRSRSRSPGPMRERDHERERDRLRAPREPRELERDRMSRDRDRLSRSRDRDRSRDRSRERSRSGSRGDAPPQYRRRCRDYDEKGFCLRGDLCQWDHGSDPVVLEDATLSRVVDVAPAPPEYNPLTPDIWVGTGFPPYPPPHLPRELVPIPRIRQPLVMPAPPPRPHLHHNNHHNKPFDYNRVGKGPRPPLPQHIGGNCSLQVKKVPRGLNDITHLNTHFSKFGKIVNIQVCFENDPEAALITFSNPTEASIAYKSTEAVLNNRFIKVFWHNPENKQENQAPTNQPPPQANKLGDKQTVNQYSQNRVLINSNNMKQTLANNNEKKEKERALLAENAQTDGKPVPPAKEKSAAVLDMYKRARALLETQLQQQVLLIQRLEAGNDSGPQRTALLEAINSAQEGIEKLRKELVAYNKMLKQMELSQSMSRLQLSQGTAKKPKTREEAQKEILDAELDMFTKQQEGQDVTELAKKIAELRRNMAIQFPVHPMRRMHYASRGRFNPASRFVRGQSKSTPPLVTPSVNQSVDHRPRALLVSGFEADEVDALIAHLTQFGEICSKDVNLSVPELVVQYKARAMAEQALLRGKHYSDRTLSITWALNPKLSSGAAANGEGSNNDETKDNHEPPSVAVNHLLDEEDDDDAEEDRSWRR